LVSNFTDLLKCHASIGHEISALLHGDACVFDDFSPTV